MPGIYLGSARFIVAAVDTAPGQTESSRSINASASVMMFDGKYHGHADELLATLDGGKVVPEGGGVPADAIRHVRIVPYNDLEAVARELARGDVACVLAEAAITNVGVILPEDGFHQGLRRLATDAGALLIIDETHTLVSGPGGLTKRWGLQPDMLVLGKSISAGIPLGAYEMSADVAAVRDTPDAESAQGVASGGTLFANALSLAAARVTLQEVLTDEAYERAARLGGRLADGIEKASAAHGFDWRSHRLFNRSGYTHAPNLPANADAARDSFDIDLYNIQRIYLANRGVWDAIDSAGPAVGIQTTADHVDRYLDILDGFLAELR